MDETSAAELDNIIACVYTITNDPCFSSLGFKPQRLSKGIKRQPSSSSSSSSDDDGVGRSYHNVPMDAALHCVIVTLIVFIIMNLLCKLLLYILM